MTFRGVVAISGLWLVATLSAPPLGAQNAPAEAEPLQEPQQPEKKKKRFPLYFEVGGGSADADDVRIALATLSTHTAFNRLSLEDQQFARAAIGWKLPNEKGSFRLIWNAYKEDGYRLSSLGSLKSVDPNLPQGEMPNNVQDPLPWWVIEITDGGLEGMYLLPQWSRAADTLEGTFTDVFGEQRNVVADNLAVDCPQLVLESGTSGVLDGGSMCEATFLVDRTYSMKMAEDMQNRAQSVDLIYGRSFGPPRYRADWWFGARYFTYKGNIPTTAWLSRSLLGGGFTDGPGIALLNFSQDTSGLGPTAYMSVNFNFFQQRLSLFLTGQAALMLYDIGTDSQDFFTLVQVGDASDPSVFHLPARLTESRNKTSWQNSIEGGVRVNLKSGVSLEAALTLNGFLDVLLVPTDIAIPISQATTQGVSAIYGTEDYRLESWRAGVSFQF